MSKPLLNLSGKQFGRLTVIDRLKEHPEFCVCRCSCGTICTVRVSALHATRSCGCLLREHGKKVIQKNHWKNNPVNQSLDAFVQRLGNKPNSNNTSGERGVYKVKSGYIAKIGLRGKRYYLGHYATLQEAAIARASAEKALYAPILEEARNLSHVHQSV